MLMTLSSPWIVSQLEVQIKNSCKDIYTAQTSRDLKY